MSRGEGGTEGGEGQTGRQDGPERSLSTEFRWVLSVAWMVGFRAGVEAAGGDYEDAFQEVGGVDRLPGAVDEIIARVRESGRAGGSDEGP